MANIHLTLSCGDYDRTRALIDGTVVTPGLDLTVIPLPSAERHTRFVTNFEFDACELQIAQYLGLKGLGAPITAIPVFPHRRFNHSCVMVRPDSDITRPEDLRGRRIGIHAHFNPIALWIRGVLQHEFGVPPSSIQWVADAGCASNGRRPVERCKVYSRRASWMLKFYRIAGPTHQLSIRPCDDYGPTIVRWRRTTIAAPEFFRFATS